MLKKINLLHFVSASVFEWRKTTWEFIHKNSLRPHSWIHFILVRRERMLFTYICQDILTQNETNVNLSETEHTQCNVHVHSPCTQLSKSNIICQCWEYKLEFVLWVLFSNNGNDMRNYGNYGWENSWWM